MIQLSNQTRKSKAPLSAYLHVLPQSLSQLLEPSDLKLPYKSVEKIPLPHRRPHPQSYLHNFYHHLNKPHDPTISSVACQPIILSGNTRFLCTPSPLSLLSLIINPIFIRLSDVTSEASVITFNVYDRSVVDQGFMGTVQIKPVLIHDHTVDQWYKYVIILFIIIQFLSNIPQTQAF